MRASLLSLILALLAGNLLAAVEIASGPKAEVTGSSAVVRWTTDVACGSRLKFGVAPEALTRKAETPGVTTDHAVTLDDLQPGMRYYFSVGTAKYELATGNFTTQGKSGKPVVVGGDTPAENPKKERAARSPEPSVAKPQAVPPLSRIWGNPSSLPDHFARHGGDFKASSPEDYARKAWEFLQRAKAEGLPAKYDESDETLRVWDPKTGTFAAYHRDGRAKTFFKPDSRGYFERQPGKPVKLTAKN